MTRKELDSKKRLIMEFAKSKTYRPMTIKEMGVVLQVPSKQKKDLRKVIEELSGEGKLQVNSKGRIKLMPVRIRILIRASAAPNVAESHSDHYRSDDNRPDNLRRTEIRRK